jgi:hypothetical protein
MAENRSVSMFQVGTLPSVAVAEDSSSETAVVEEDSSSAVEAALNHQEPDSSPSL